MGMHGMKKKPVKKMMGGTKKMPGGGGLYKMAPGGKMKKATNADVTKAVMGSGGKKPSAGAIKMAKGILKKAGMSAAYGTKVVRKKKK